MDGLLVIDKPAGLTSHDVVAWARRILRERRVGHTGTLDPAATGVLPLVVGRATRLARFLSAATKSYEAVVQLGVSTDTADAAGRPIGAAYEGPLPSRERIEQAVDAFRGTFEQQPPAYSAKRVGGTRSYKIARAASGAADSPQPPAVPVTVHRIEIVDIVLATVTLRVDCSAGFYVRALAHDLGARLGVGGHLAALRRTRTGDYTLEDAAGLEALDRDPGEAIRRLIPLGSMLPALPTQVLTGDGVRRARNGQDLGPGDMRPVGIRIEPCVRLLDPQGDLVGIGEPSATPGLLHPSVVLM